MFAYPYVVEFKLTNPNTLETRLLTRRVYAYTVSDACTQALLEASTEAGSSKVDIVTIGPPPECYAPSTLTALAREIAAATRPVPPDWKTGKPV